MESNQNQDERKPVIIQPNAITSARYEYSQMQKDFMYHFIDKMNMYMTKDQTLMRDLFGNLVIKMDLKDIVKSGNYTPMLDAIKDLQKKPISYKYNRNKSEYEVSTHLVASIVHKKGTGKISITTTEASLPVILHLNAGFTAFNKSIALSLPSYYAKRMYELCCRWKDKGFCRMTVLEFRKMMMVEDKFKNMHDLTKNILERSEKILSEQADLTYTYTLRKENKSKSYNWIELNIFLKTGDMENKSGWYQTLYGVLYQVYFDSTAMIVCDWLVERNELKRASERFKRLYKDIEKGIIKPHGIRAYVNSVLKREYEVPENMLLDKAKEKKKKKAEKTMLKLAAEKVSKEAREAAKRKNDTRTPSQMAQLIIGSTGDGEDQRGGDARSLADIMRDGK